MSLPVISNNTPAGGSISWTAFGITYAGVSYSIPAGNSPKKFVWWVYNAGAPYLAADDAFPVMAQEDLLLFLNKTGIGLLAPTADVFDGGLVVPGSIYATAIAADQINTYHLLANAVTTAKIAADAVTATQIQADAIGTDELAANAVYAEHVTAGAITTDKLSVGSVGDSLITNGSFEEFANGMPIGWTGTVSGGAGSIDIVTGVASSGANAARLVVGSTATTCQFRSTPDRYVPVTSGAGRKWYIGAMIGAGTATTNGLYLRAVWYDASKAYLSYFDVVANAAVTTSFALFEGQATPPSNARYMSVEVNMVTPNVITNVYVDEVVAREVVISAQIGDGAITAPKLLANSVVADKIAARAVGAEKLIVADINNYWQNADFEADAVGAVAAGLVTGTNHRVKDISAWAGPVGTGAGNGSSRALEVDALNGSNSDVYDAKIFPVTPGDQYYIYYEGRHLNTVGTGATGVGFRTYNAAKSAITWTNVVSFGASKVTVMTPMEGVYTVPAGTYFLQPWVTFANNAETTNKFIVDNIEMRRMNAGELIVDGSITGNKVLAKSITTDKLTISSTDNLIAGADFSAPAVWEQVATNKTINATAGRGSVPALRFTGTVSTQTSVNLQNKVPVGSEDRFRGAMWVKSSAALAASTVALKAKAYTTASAFTNITIATNQLLVVNTWTNVAGISPVLPAGTIALEFFLEVTNNATGTTTDIDFVGVTRAFDSNLFVDGAIDGKVITGSTIQTAASGARLVMDATSLKGFDSNNKQYLTADSAGITIDGTLDVLGTGYVLNGGGTGYNTTPVKMIVGAGAARMQTIVTEQLPPYAPASGSDIPGLIFKPTATTMYDYAGIISESGVGLTLSGGKTQADVTADADNWQSCKLTLGETEVWMQSTSGAAGVPGTMNLSTTGAVFNVPVKDQKAYIILNKTDTQSLTTANTFYNIGWNSVPYKNRITHSTSTNNHQITIQDAGVYTVTYKTAVNQNTGQVSGAISINGTQQSNSIQRVGNNSGQFEKCGSTQQFVFAVGDVITIQVSSGVAGALADGVNFASIKCDVAY